MMGPMAGAQARTVRQRSLQLLARHVAVLVHVRLEPVRPARVVALVIVVLGSPLQ